MSYSISQVKWQQAVVDFEILSIRPQRLSTRVAEGGQYKMNFQDDKFFQVNHVSDTGVESLALSITGKAKIPSGDITFYLNFYPQRMGSQFISSPSLADIVNSEDFLNETPEHQADFLNMLLKSY